jgi:drug/metabolite transporter (DMT)-like permease
MDTNQAPQDEQSRRKLSYVLLAIGCILLVIAFLIGVGDNPPGIVSMLVGFFLLVLGIIYRFGKSGKRKPAQQLLYWAPRVLCIVTAMFISMFALDVFSEGQGFWGTAVALFMHLIPTFLILVLLFVSWRREWIGGILFILLGVLYVVWAWNKPFASSAIPLISGPLVLTGALFLLNWYYRVELRRTS